MTTRKIAIDVPESVLLLYLHRIEALDWLPKLGERVWIPQAVQDELSEGMRKGYDVPEPQHYEWVTVTDPRVDARVLPGSPA